MKTFTKILFISLGTIAFTAIAQEQQIHIKTRFFELPKSTLDALQKNFEVTSDGAEMLTPEQMKALLKSLRSNSGVKTFAEPEVVTTSGRHTQMRATTIQTIITDFVFQESTFVDGKQVKNAISPKTENVEFGPVLDVVPSVSNDGLKIELTTTASDTKFFGYADTTTRNMFGFRSYPHERWVTNSAGQKIGLPEILPVQQMNQASAKVTLTDGQTLVLFPKVEPQTDERLTKHIAQAEKKNGEKFLVVLITPTFVDYGGNRIHSDN
jgi:Flp pilus assembly secretin CpaC